MPINTYAPTGLSLYALFADADSGATAVALAEGTGQRAGMYSATNAAIAAAGLSSGVWPYRVLIGSAASPSLSDAEVAVGQLEWAESIGGEPAAQITLSTLSIEVDEAIAAAEAAQSQAAAAATAAVEANGKLPADASTRFATLPTVGTVATTDDFSTSGGASAYQIARTVWAFAGNDSASEVGADFTDKDNIGATDSIIGLLGALLTRAADGGNVWRAAAEDSASEFNADWTDPDQFGVNDSILGRLFAEFVATRQAAQSSGTVSPEIVPPHLTWRFDPESDSVKATRPVSVHASFAGTLQFDVADLLGDAAIASATGVTVNGSPASGVFKHTSDRRVLFESGDLPTVTAATDFYVTCSFLTTDSQSVTVVGVLRVKPTPAA